MTRMPGRSFAMRIGAQLTQFLALASQSTSNQAAGARYLALSLSQPTASRRSGDKLTLLYDRLAQAVDSGTLSANDASGPEGAAAAESARLEIVGGAGA